MAKKDSTELKILFGKNVKRIRTLKGYTLLKVDYGCELNESNISKIENGKSDVQLSTLVELAKGLGVEPKELLDFDFGVNFKKEEEE